MSVYKNLDEKKYKQILKEEELDELEFNKKNNHTKYDQYVNDYNKFNDVDYNDYEVIEIEEHNDIDIGETIKIIYYWGIRVGIVISIILMLYFIINLDIISIVLYLLILVTSFSLGYIAAFFYSDKIKNI